MAPDLAASFFTKPIPLCQRLGFPLSTGERLGIRASGIKKKATSGINAAFISASRPEEEQGSSR